MADSNSPTDKNNTQVFPPWISNSGDSKQNPNPPPQQQEKSVPVESGNKQAPASTKKNPPETPSSIPSISPSVPKEELNSPSSPNEANFVKESPFKRIIPIAGAILVIGLLFFLGIKIFPKLTQKSTKEETSGASPTSTKTTKKPVSLKYWGLWEPESVMTQLIAEYKKENPEVSIEYSQQSPKDYRERLQSALARGEGPDIFRFHNSWVPMLKKELAPAPTNVNSTINLSANFFQVISTDLTLNNQALGIPIGFDTLVLFYNTKIFNQAGKTPPTTWEELRTTAIDLTVKDVDGRIQTAGVALGTTNNVDHWSDILGLMMMQNGVNLSQPNSEAAQDALKFYTIFKTTDKVWDETLPPSVYAFATEKVAMIFAPSWQAHEIRKIDPNLNFKTLPVPQLPGQKIGWATYWAEGVWNKSNNQEEAWKFLQFLTQKQTLINFYNAASQIRQFGEPYPRIDLVSQIEQDPIVGAVVKQGSYAKSWYLCGRTWDNGIDDKIIKYFEDAINSFLQGETAADVLNIATSGISQVLSQYGVGTAQATQ